MTFAAATKSFNKEGMGNLLKKVGVTEEKEEVV